jgi:hypothetical protein
MTTKAIKPIGGIEIDEKMQPKGSDRPVPEKQEPAGQHQQQSNASAVARPRSAGRRNGATLRQLNEHAFEERFIGHN